MKRIMLVCGAMLTVACALARTVGTDADTLRLTPEESKTEQLKDSHIVVFAGSGEHADSDSVRALIERFYVDQFRSFQEPEAPCFMLMSKDARLALGIGGVIRMRGWADFAGAVPVNGFYPYLIPVPSDPATRKDFKGTPAGTSIYMKIIGKHLPGHNLEAYVLAQFSGYDNIDFKLKKAYVTIDNVTVGYSTTTFSDVAAEAPIIDGGGSNGKTSLSAMLVRWLHDFGNAADGKTKPWQVAASLEIPASRVGADGVFTKRTADWLPDLAAYIQWSWNRGSHLRLAAIGRVLSYRDLVGQQNCNVAGWGAQLSGVAKLTRNFSVYGTVNGGKGYASHVGDLSIGSYDLIADPERNGQMYAPYAASATFGVKYYFTNQWYTTASAGQVRYWPRAGAAPTEYKYGRYANLNVYYEPTPRLQFGVEGIVGDRHNINGEHAAAHRLDFMFQFAF